MTILINLERIFIGKNTTAKFLSKNLGLAQKLTRFGPGKPEIRICITFRGSYYNQETRAQL